MFVNSHTIDPKVQEILANYIARNTLGQSFYDTALSWYLPLAEKIVLHQNNARRPVFVAINGCQGSGKSTLTGLLVELISALYKKRIVGFSIDDFYLSKEKRNTLAQKNHPLLATRGVPGTHDTDLLKECLDKLLKTESNAANEFVNIPKFNKSIDDLYPQSDWISIAPPVDIVVLEGWCVGTRPQSAPELIQPVNELEHSKDPTGSWRHFCNDKLTTEYLKIFNQIDYLIMLKAPSFSQVYNWRLEQEHKLIASLSVEENRKSELSSNIATMSDQEIKTFIQFYQRLTEHSLTNLPAKCDSIFYLDNSRRITQCQHL